MIDDGLYEPLGQSPRGGWPAWLIPVGLTVAGALLVGSWTLLQREPPRSSSAGSPRPGPQAAAPLEPGLAAGAAKTPPVPVPPAQASSVVAVAPAAGHARSGGEIEEQSGVTVVRPPGAGAGPGTFLPVPQSDSVALSPAPDPRLVEKGRYGILPRRGADGTRPADVYGRPMASAAGLQADAPRIALFVGGMGLNGALTADAAQALPPSVTLGFAPYGSDLPQQVAEARARGHEAVLQVPMESFDAPDGAAMPHLLTIGESARETLDNLHWQMSRFVGYAGVSSFLGGKFTGDAAAFRPVLRDIGDRGLFYFDDGTAARSLAGSLGSESGVPTLKADVAIDALADPAEVNRSLKKLEDLARAKGVAVGSTTGLPTMVDHLAGFTRELSSRGIALVPLSSVVAGPKSASAP